LFTVAESSTPIRRIRSEVCARGTTGHAAMSALGQKQTFAAQNGMSALPPVATSIAFFGMSALGQ